MDGMNRQHYRHARLIEEGLSQAGHPDWALRIDDAIEDGSSAPEILTALQSTLTQVQSQHLGLPTELDEKIEDLARAIDRTQASTS